MKPWKEIVASPIWYIPVGLLCIFISIEGIHLAKHDKYCKTKAQWMHESGLEYERESEAQ